MSAVPLPPTVKGWCPGALRPMVTGDGLLVRLRITGGIVSPAVLRAVATLARTQGNGLVDLSQRANLQLRGVRDELLPHVWAALRRLDLLDEDPKAEGVRNVIGPPLAGIDPAATVDGLALVRGLEARLRSDTELHALPDKFGFLVDQGGALTLADVPCDVRLVGSAAGVRIQLGGTERDAADAGIWPETEAVAAAVAFAKAFLALRGTVTPPARRMRDLVAQAGVARIVEAATVHGFPAVATDHGTAVAVVTDTPVAVGPRPADAPDSAPSVTPPGPPPSGGIGRLPHVLAHAPFGRLTAEQLDGLADLSPAGIRLTPWRAVVVPFPAPDVPARLTAIGLLTDPADPRLAIAACPGLACSSGQVDARGAAERLAPRLVGRTRPGETLLHVSACSKGCARSGPAPLVLVGREGAFDLVIDGRADGEPVRRGLDLDGAAAAIADELKEGDAA